MVARVELASMNHSHHPFFGHLELRSEGVLETDWESHASCLEVRDLRQLVHSIVNVCKFVRWVTCLLPLAGHGLYTRANILLPARCRIDESAFIFRFFASTLTGAGNPWRLPLSSNSCLVGVCLRSDHASNVAAFNTTLSNDFFVLLNSVRSCRETNACKSWQPWMRFLFRSAMSTMPTSQRQRSCFENRLVAQRFESILNSGPVGFEIKTWIVGPSLFNWRHSCSLLSTLVPMREGRNLLPLVKH